MRRVAIGAGVVLLLLVVVLLAGWIALQRMDWNRFKEPIAQAAFDATGRHLDLSGDLDLQIGLRPGVRLEGVGFENAAWGSRPKMASVERVTVRFQLLPLLGGNLLVDRVEVAGLDLLLETSKDGTANWTFAPPPAQATGRTAPQPAPAPGGPGEEPAPDAGSESTPFTAFLQHAEIASSAIEVRNAETGAVSRLVVKRLVARSEDPSAPLELDLDAEYNGSPIRLSGSLTGVAGLAGAAASGPLGVDLDAEAGGATLAVEGDVGEPLAGNAISLGVHMEVPRLGAVGALVGADVPDLGPVRLAFQLQGSKQALTLRDLELVVGSSQLRGEVDVNLAQARPKIDARLTSSRLDAADFEAPASGQAATAAPAGAGAPAATKPAAPASATASRDRIFPADPLPLDGLAAADLALKLDVAELHAGGQVQSDVELSLSLLDRVLELKRFASVLQGGRLEAKMKLDSARSTPALALSGQARGVELGKLLQASGSDVLRGGPLDLDFDLTGDGRSLREIMASLDGVIEVDVGKASVNDTTAGLVLSDLMSVVDGAGSVQGAELSCAYAKLVAVEGVVKPDGIVADLGSIALFGDGRIDLRDERLKLRFDRVAQTVAASSALPPLVVKGTLAAPEAGLDAEALAVKLVDLGTTLLEGEKAALAARAADCHELLARFQQQQSAQGSHDDRAREAAKQAVDAIGGKTGKQGKKIFDAMKGILDARP